MTTTDTAKTLATTSIFILLIAFLMASFSAAALAHSTGSEDMAYVRVVSADPASKTYTFSCDTDPNMEGGRDFFIRPDSGNFGINLPNEAESHDRPKGNHFTYTFQEDMFYHVGCVIVDFPPPDYQKVQVRGDLHIDLRSQDWDPNVRAVNSSGKTATLECTYNGEDKSISWRVLNAQTGAMASLGSGSQVTYTAPEHGLYDFICDVNDHITGESFAVPFPVEFFDSGDPYFPDQQGVPHGVTSEWTRDGSGGDKGDTGGNNETDNSTDNGNGNNTGGDTGTACYNSVSELPSSCNGGTITHDEYTGCRKIVCESGSNSIQVQACDKEGKFEMYKQGQTGSGLEVCLGNTCIKDNGFASEPFPACVDDTGSDDDDTEGDEGGDTGDGDTGSGEACYSSLSEIPAECTGASISADSMSGACRQITCGGLQVQACEKGGFFEMYKQSSTSGVGVCLAGTCISDNGFAKSNTYPVCTSGSGDTGGDDDTGSNNAPSQPVWLEPSEDGKTGVDPHSFKLHVDGFSDTNGDSHLATDFEIWDVNANQRVWSAIHETLNKNRIESGDGVFEGSRAGSDRLDTNTQYMARARFEDEHGTKGEWTSWRHFTTRSELTFDDSEWGWTPRSGFKIERVAKDVNLPTVLEDAPDIYGHLPFEKRPKLYITHLYGQIGVLLNDNTYVEYANGLLNFDSFGSLPGSGEIGLTGLYADETTGDLFVSIVYYDSNQEFKGKVVRFFSNSDGTGHTGTQTIIDDIPVAPAHQIHAITRGPDGKLYLNTGDDDNAMASKDLSTLTGKILRMNEDGSIPSNNPHGSNNYVYSSGFRNHMGAAWRPGTNELFVTHNGPDDNDGIYKVHPGSQFGWCCDTVAGTWHLWPETRAPTELEFDEGFSRFPSSSQGNLYAVTSGKTYAQGQSLHGKRIVQFGVNSDGSSQPMGELVTYTGDGYGTPMGLEFLDDGMYFSDIYGEDGFVGIGKTRGNIYRVVPGTQTQNPNSGDEPTGLSASIGNGRWYPQGLDMVWVCNAHGGNGNYKYDFILGDGNKQTNLDSDNVYHTYPSEGSYEAFCRVHDQSTGETVESEHTTLVLGDKGSGDGDTGGNDGDTGTGDGCFNSVESIPAECSGGIITEDSFTGCRNIVCEASGSSLAVKACDKEGKFEMYKQSGSGSGLSICLGNTCIDSNSGFASGDFPVCTEGTGDTTGGTGETGSGETEFSVNLHVKQWYPQGRDYVFVCDEQGFTASSYFWKFGDGQTQATSSNEVYHTYASSGSKTVSCEASGSTGSATGTHSISVS